MRTPARGDSSETVCSAPNASDLKERLRSMLLAPTRPVYISFWLVKLAGGCPLASDCASSAPLTVSPCPAGRTLRKVGAASAEAGAARAATAQASTRRRVSVTGGSLTHREPARAGWDRA